MNGKKARGLCIACLCISLLSMIFLTMRGASERAAAGIVGGADMPTLMLALRQTLHSAAGVVLCGTAVISALVLLFLLIKDAKGRKR